MYEITWVIPCKNFHNMQKTANVYLGMVLWGAKLFLNNGTQYNIETIYYLLPLISHFFCLITVQDRQKCRKLS